MEQFAMPATTKGSVFNITHDNDPAEEIRKSVGNIDNFRPGPGKVLLAIYKRPEKIGSIYRPNTNKEEDVFQGKVWLVLKQGPMCFMDSDQGSYGGFKAEVGEWVLARNSDGYRFDLCGSNSGEGYECLIIQDRYIKMVVPTPYSIW